MKKNVTDIIMNKSGKVNEENEYKDTDNGYLSIDRPTKINQSFLSDYNQLPSSKITLSVKSNLRQKIQSLFLAKGILSFSNAEKELKLSISDNEFNRIQNRINQFQIRESKMERLVSKVINEISFNAKSFVYYFIVSKGKPVPFKIKFVEGTSSNVSVFISSTMKRPTSYNCTEKLQKIYFGSIYEFLKDKKDYAKYTENNIYLTFTSNKDTKLKLLCGFGYERLSANIDIKPKRRNINFGLESIRNKTDIETKEKEITFLDSYLGNEPLYETKPTHIINENINVKNCIIKRINDRHNLSFLYDMRKSIASEKRVNNFRLKLIKNTIKSQKTELLQFKKTLVEDFVKKTNSIKGSNKSWIVIFKISKIMKSIFFILRIIKRRDLDILKRQVSGKVIRRAYKKFISKIDSKVKVRSLIKAKHVFSLFYLYNNEFFLQNNLSMLKRIIPSFSLIINMKFKLISYEETIIKVQKAFKNFRKCRKDVLAMLTVIWKSETASLLSELKSPSKKNKSKGKKTIQNILNITKEKIDQVIKDFINLQLKNYRENYKNWLTKFQEINKKKDSIFESKKIVQDNEGNQKDIIDQLKEEEITILYKRPILNFIPKPSQLREIILSVANEEKSL